MSQSKNANGQRLNGDVPEPITYRGQFGEVPILMDVLDRIGIRNEWCVEIGAGDGVELSNTLHLRTLGWSALLVEQDPDLYVKLVANVVDMTGGGFARDVHTANIKANGVILGALMQAAGCPVDLDFLSIDIDGEDYWLWADLPWFKPRVVCVEFGSNTKPDVLPPRGASQAAHYQAGEQVIRELGEQLGYKVAGRTAVNVIFERKDA